MLTAPFFVSELLGGRTIGSTSDSGSDYLGSSPSLPANLLSKLPRRGASFSTVANDIRKLDFSLSFVPALTIARKDHRLFSAQLPFPQKRLEAATRH